MVVKHNFTPNPEYPHLFGHDADVELANKTDWDEISSDPTLSWDLVIKYQDRINWTIFSAIRPFSEQRLKQFEHMIDWYVVGVKSVIPLNMIAAHRNEVNWSDICRHQTLDCTFIHDFSEYVDWVMVSKYQKLTEEFMNANMNKLYWVYISQYQTLSEDFIRRHTQYIDWSCISNNKFTNEFIDEFKGRLNWSLLNNSSDKALGFDFVLTHLDYVDWHNITAYENLDLSNPDIKAFVVDNMHVQQNSIYTPIDWDTLCQYQVIPEDMLRDNAEYNNWSIVCRYQTLSEDFIDYFKDDVDWEAVSKYQNISTDFIENNIEYLYKYIINFFNRDEYYTYMKEHYQYPVRVGDIDIVITPVETEGDSSDTQSTLFTTTFTADDNVTGSFIYRVGPYPFDVVYGENINMDDDIWTNIVSGDTVNIPVGFVLTAALVSAHTGIIVASDTIVNEG